MNLGEDRSRNSLWKRSTIEPCVTLRSTKAETDELDPMGKVSPTSNHKIFGADDSPLNYTSSSLSSIFGIPCLMVNSLPLSGQIKVPSSTCTSSKYLCSRLRKASSSSMEGVTYGTEMITLVTLRTCQHNKGIPIIALRKYSPPLERSRHLRHCRANALLDSLLHCGIQPSQVLGTYGAESRD